MVFCVVLLGVVSIARSGIALSITMRYELLNSVPAIV